MRLDLYTATNTDATVQVGQTGKGAAPKSQVQTQKPTTEATTEDTTSLSSGSDSVHSLTKAALEVSPTRAARVAALKQAVATDQYQLDAAQIAESLSSAVV